MALPCLLRNLSLAQFAEHYGRREDFSFAEKAKQKEAESDAWSTTTGSGDTEDGENFSISEEISSLFSFDSESSLEDIGSERPVLTADPARWDIKFEHALEAGADNIFWVCDFDRTLTRCFL